jgi:Rieske Fe-S protein
MPALFNIRRRDFLHLGAALAAMTCGGETDEPTTSLMTGDDTTGETGDTGDDTTGDPPDPTTTDDPATTAPADTGETGDTCTPSGTDTGLLVADFEPGACMTAMNLADTYVLRDDDGFYAMTNRCTHSGCVVGCPNDDLMICPCHNSQYNANGDILSGPAPSDLRHYLVSFECVGADIKIYVDKAVALDDRQTRAVPP